MARFLIVDAHSIIFAWPELRALHARRMVLAREVLIQRMTLLQDVGDTRVVVVFDGQGSRVQEETLPGGVQVFYSATGQTADAVVERLAAAYAGVHEITVATGDRLERETASAFGASTLSPEMLHVLVKDAEQELGQTLKKLQKSAKSSRKRE